jgi:hypothetical protein
MATESEILPIVLTAINAKMPAGKQATEPSAVPATRPAEQTIVTVAERAGGPSRGGRRATRGWQVYVFSASAYSEENVRKSLEAAHEALANVVLTIGDEHTTPIEVGPSRAISPDDGSFSGSKSYLFAI